MQHEFWHKRWQQNQIGFHKQDVNSFLIKYWPHLKNQHRQQRIFVPLCGKSHDLLWFRTMGYHVAGVELSPLAVDAFFEENKLQPRQRRYGEFQIREIDGIQLWCGDYFSLTAEGLGQIDAIYDRASLVALPPDMRVDYAQHLASLANPYTEILLVAFEYPQHEMAGPPFSVDTLEIERLFGDWCDIELLGSEDTLALEPHFKQRGLTKMEEKIYRLEVR